MISIVIPIYNEQENINMLYDRITAAAPAWGEDYEVMMVDDGSTDRSLPMMSALAERDARFKVLQLSRNFGHQAAISAGLSKTKGDAVVIMDGDLQDPPEELHRFLDKWREGYQVVYAIRTKRKESFFKRVAYKVFYRMLSAISDIEIPLDSGDFCLMDRVVVDTMEHELPEKIRFVRGLRAYAGFKQIGVEYERAARVAGEEKYTFRMLVKLALDGLLGFSDFPLRLATYLGFFMALFSFLIGVVILFLRVTHLDIFGYAPEEVPGMASLSLGIFFLGGVNLMVLGVIGNYIGRIYFEVKKRPTFIIDQFIDNSNA